MKRNWFKLLLPGLLMTALGIWVACEVRWSRVNDPRGRFSNWSEYIAQDRQPGRVVEVTRDGVRYLVAFGPMDPWLAVPSGPAAYVFDPDGKLVDWTGDSGDDPAFQVLWLQDANVQSQADQP